MVDVLYFLHRFNLFHATLLWLVAANCVGFVAMWSDKRRSEEGLWRIPESRLLGFALIGGSLGTLIAGQKFRHKTRKQPFRSRLFMIVMLQFAASTALAFPQVRTALADTFLS